MDVYLVWSHEHGAWWRPNGRGYTTDINRAGRYTREEAIAHSKSRDQHAGQPLPELPVREADVRECVAPMHWTTELARAAGHD